MNQSLKLLTVAVCLLLLFACQPAAREPKASASPSRSADGSTLDLSAIDAAVEARMESDGVPGVAVAIVEGGEVLLAKGYGMADLEHQVRVGPQTMFQSGSVGKMFTAAGIMALVEDGALDLDASIRTYLAEGPETWAPITLRHLLSHTSGIPDYTSDELDYTRQYSEADLIRMASELPLEFPAGARWNYSNTAYVLLGIITNRVAEMPYWEHLRQRIWDPAAVPTMRVNFATEIVPHRASGYEPEDGVFYNQEWVSPSLNSTADGSLLFSLEDMIAWNEAVRNRTVLASASWDEMLTPIELNSGNTYPYGFGWAVTTVSDHPVHMHGGGWQGFRTQFTRYVDADVAVVVLANSSTADPDAIAVAVAEIIDPSFAPQPPSTTPIDDPAPEVTAFIAGMLEKAATSGLELEDFAFIRQTSFPWVSEALLERLDGLGAPDGLDLMERHQIGDDINMTYLAKYGDRSFRVSAAVAPSGGLTRLRVRELDE